MDGRSLACEPRRSSSTNVVVALHERRDICRSVFPRDMHATRGINDEVFTLVSAREALVSWVPESGGEAGLGSSLEM